MQPVAFPFTEAPLVTVPMRPKPAAYLRCPTQCADAILDGFTQQSRRVVLCKGQVDMADLVLAGARVTGPCRVSVSAWEIDQDDILTLGAAVKDGRIQRLQLITEPGVRREGNTWERARAAFGEHNVLFTATHAKVAVLENERWSLVIRGSMNMRRQRVVEQLEVEHSPEIAAAWTAYARDPQAKPRYPGDDAPALGRAALTKLPAGGRLWGLTSGFSTVNLLGAALDRVGPADVEIAGFKIASRFAQSIAAHPSVRSLRVLVSPGFTAKDPKETEAVEGWLGPERVKLAWTHSRWFTVKGERGTVAVHSSGNMNANPRVEQYDASEEPETVGFFSDFFAEMWEQTPNGLKTPRPQIVDVLRRLLRDQKGTGLVSRERRPPPPPVDALGLDAPSPGLAAVKFPARLARADPPLPDPRLDLLLPLPPPESPPPPPFDCPMRASMPDHPIPLRTIDEPIPLRRADAPIRLRTVDAQLSL